MATKIEWTEETWNPIVGCSKVSQGCKNCYAETMARRIKAMGNPHYDVVIGDNGKWNGQLHFVGDAMLKPLKRRKPTTWFVNSMSDLFHEDALFVWQDKVWEIMAQAPQHTYQILTKRAGIMCVRVLELVEKYGVLPNVWLGVSVEDQGAANERISFLVDTPAAIRFLSCEPLLGPVSLFEWIAPNCMYKAHCHQKRTGHHCYSYQSDPDNLRSVCPVCDTVFEDNKPLIDWVIVGGESGPKARSCHPDWVRTLLDECQTAQIPFFFKQWGGTNKKKAGNLLDSKVWNQYPQMQVAQ